MKRSLVITSSLSLLCMSAVSVAQNTPPLPSGPTPPSIVTLNFSAAVLATAEAQRDLGALQTKFAPKESQLHKLNDAIDAEKKQLTDATIKLSDSERSAKSLELNSKEKQLQRDAEDFKNDSQSESQQVFQRVAQKVFGLLQDYSQQHGYSAVIERGTDSAPIVWYAASNIDITEQVTKAYDAKFGVVSSDLPDKPSANSDKQGRAAHPQPLKPNQQ